jgi:hypothetical protein
MLWHIYNGTCVCISVARIVYSPLVRAQQRIYFSQQAVYNVPWNKVVVLIFLKAR